MPVGTIAAARRRGGVVSAVGALVRKSSSQAIGTSFAALTFDTELYDATGWHDTVTNNTRLTVPAAVSLVRAVSGALSTNNTGTFGEHTKGGAVFRGMGLTGVQSSGINLLNLASAPIAVSAADYFENLMVVGTGSTGVTNDEESWFSIEALSASTKYALVYHNTTQAISSGVTLTVAFNSEIADTNSFHDTVTNNSRLTVPSGVTLVRVSANMAHSAASGTFLTSLLKNGASARGLPACNTTTSGGCVNVISAPLVVTTGDYFQATVLLNAAANLVSIERQWFAIEEVPSTYKRALVYKTGSQSITAATPTVLTWDAEEYDTDSIHDNATNNSRLTVPSGVTKARPLFSIKTGNTAGRMDARVTKGGADYFGQPTYSCDTTGADYLSAMGAWVDVSPGDYFECVFTCGTGTTVSTDNETWFCLECQ